MGESILLPSPNWFQVSILGISKDGWLVYGGPHKSICVLEPLQKEDQIIADNQTYKTHTVFKAHPEKVVSIDISPEWSRKRCFLAGSADGTVKQWTIEGSGKNIKIKSTLSHEFHVHEKEEVAGVGYSLGAFALTVGGFGNIVKWDLQSNVLKANTYYLKNFKPICMSCSPHLPLQVAVGTKQGVIFVFDFSGPGKIVYKVRGQDEEIINISWCPQFKVNVKKTYKESANDDTLSFASDFDEPLQKDGTKDSVGTANPLEDEVAGNDLNEGTEVPTTVELENKPDDKGDSKEMQPKGAVNVLEASGMVKNLPEDSFDEAIVAEDDMFDIYKDHEADEFGHKKYQPQEIYVKVKQEVATPDFLAECMKLKEDILQKKNDEEQSIQSLVDAMDKTHVESEKDNSSASKVTQIARSKQSVFKTSDHLHRHMLASVGKYGGVRIWSKAGKLVATCAVPVNTGKNPRNKAPNWPTLLWYKPNSLLIADGKSELLEIDPLVINSKNRLEWRPVHSFHKRGLYCIVSEAPRIQVPTDDHWPIWTVSQDRNLIKYCMKTRQKLASYASCGGYVYNIQACPYDAGKIATCVGDGAVRVWQTSFCGEDESKLCFGRMTTYWQNVQGKVLKLAWHPFRENLLAFSTAEARVGTIDTSGKNERPARALPPALNGGVYALCWGENNQLYACGGGELVIYQVDKRDQFPERVVVEVDGQGWELTDAQWHAHGLLVGSATGAVAVLQPRAPHAVLAVAFLFKKMIYTVDWHPQQVSSSNEESPYKNHIAVCSMDKQGDIAIIEYGDKEDNTKQLTLLKMLSGHKGAVHDLKWNPHRDAQLMSTSADGTIKVWCVASGAATHVVCGGAAQLAGAWSAQPAQARALLAGGADYTLRLWDVAAHPADDYDESLYTPVLQKKEKKKFKPKTGEPKPKDEYFIDTEEQVATNFETRVKSPKKFLLPTISRQINNGRIDGVRRLFLKYMAKQEGYLDVPGPFDKKEYEVEYLKMFGTMTEVNDLLDSEMQRHMDTGNFEAWAILSVFRGLIDPMIQYASQQDLLCPYLISLTPCVSFKYWKDATHLYISQIDRLVAKGEEPRLCENRTFGGAVLRKTATLLSVHDIMGAVATLKEAHLYKEAYILCRIRYMESIAEETLQEWASVVEYSGNTILAAVCYMILGNYNQAVLALGKMKSPECLTLAAELAKVTGQALFADHIGKKALTEEAQISSNSTTEETTEETLPELPSRVEMLMNENEEDSESLTNEDSGLDE